MQETLRISSKMPEVLLEPNLLMFISFPFVQLTQTSKSKNEEDQESHLTQAFQLSFCEMQPKRLGHNEAKFSLVNLHLTPCEFTFRVSLNEATILRKYRLS